MEKTKITEAELEVMKVLWQNSPLSAAEIIEVLQKQKAWSSKTIRTLIDRLCSKGQIIADRTAKQLMFTPSITKKEYERQTRLFLAEQLYDGSVGKLLVSFVDQKELTQEDIIELKNLLNTLGKQ